MPTYLAGFLYQMFWRKFLALPIILAAIGIPVKASAVPAEIFRPHLNAIGNSVPPGWKMRLPSRILLGGPADEDFISELTVRVFPSTTPAGLTVGLFSCDSGGFPCLVGSFSVASQSSANAQREFIQHQAAAQVITLARGIKGYLLEGQKQSPPNTFSSVMWQQDGMIYTVSFLAEERQNILFMASSMANESPIR